MYDIRFSCFGFVKANGEHCNDACAHWVFQAGPTRHTKAEAIGKNEILYKDHVECP